MFVELLYWLALAPLALTLQAPGFQWTVPLARRWRDLVMLLCLSGIYNPPIRRAAAGAHCSCCCHAQAPHRLLLHRPRQPCQANPSSPSHPRRPCILQVLHCCSSAADEAVPCLHAGCK